MTGLIFGTIVAAWAAVLVPMWLRRHDERNEARSVERFSAAMRVLSRRGASAPQPRPDARDVVMPRRERVADVHVSGPSSRAQRERRPIVPLRTVRSSATPPPAATPAGRSPRVSASSRPSPRPSTARPGATRPARLLRGVSALRPVPHAPARTLVVRRRRTLVALVAALVVTALLALVHVAAWWGPVLVVLLVLGYAVHLRAQAKVAAETSRRRTAMDRRTAARSVRRSTTDRVRRGRPGAQVAQDETAAPLDELLERWEPRDVPLPTYVSKPTAPRLPDAAVAAFWGDAGRDDDEVASAAPAPSTPEDEHDVALDEELGAILERRRVVGE